MKNVILTVLKVIGVVLLVLIVLIAALLFWLSRRPFVPNSYTKTVDTGGTIEARYLAMGPYAVKQGKAEAPEDWKELVAYYPAELEGSGEKWPAVVFVNGTGVYASKYPALFRHLASWGFIVLGNEDPAPSPATPPTPPWPGCWRRTKTRTACSIRGWTRTTWACPATPRGAWGCSTP